MDDKKKLMLYGLTAIGVVVVVLVVVFIVTMLTSGTSYSKVENTMKSAAKDYFTEDKLPANGETVSINVTTLVAEEYMKSLEDLTKDSSCVGYVEVYNNNGEYIYFPVLNCAKYQSNTLGKTIMTDLVETGDGLYSTDIGYIYKGEKVNNYVSFAGQIWRIIRVDDTGVRLIANTPAEKKVKWDNRYNIDTDNYNGINNYKVSRIKDTLEEYYNDEEIFSDDDREHILLHNVCIGKRHGDDATMNYFGLDCAEVLENQYVSLLSAGEYAMASLDGNCTTIAGGSCSNYNYFRNTIEESWTVTGLSNASNMVFYVNSIGVYSMKANSSTKYHPVIYLHKNEIITDGDGSLEEPYVIK